MTVQDLVISGSTFQFEMDYMNIEQCYGSIGMVFIAHSSSSLQVRAIYILCLTQTYILEPPA